MEIPVPGLYNGISQQPPSLRTLNQLESCQNVMFDVRDGASKRPGTWIERVLLDGIDNTYGARLHPIVRSQDEKYYVVIGNGCFRVYEIAGPQAEVTISPSAQTYLNSFPAVLDRFRLITATDTTFIVNTQVPTLARELTGTITTISIDTAAEVFSAGHGLVNGDTVIITGTNSTPVIDGTHIVQVLDSDRFTVPVTTTGTGNAGSWNSGQLNPLNMPVKMVRESFTGDGVTPAVFRMDVIAWNQRQSGTALINPPAKFIVDGLPIADLAIDYSRMVIGGGGRIAMSQTDDLYNFFNTDSTNIVESDPIGIQVGSGQASDVDFLIPIRKSLLVFTKGGQQFEISSEGAMTQANIRVTPTISCRYLSFKPVVIDPNVYFISRAEQAVQVHEYIYDEVALQSTFNKITAHVPQLISLDDTVNKCQVLALASSPDTNNIFVLTSSFNAAGDALSGVDLYVYKTEYKDGQRVQIAWTQFVFSPTSPVNDYWTCWHMTVIGDLMYLLVSSKPDGVNQQWYVEAMPLLRGGDLAYEPDFMVDPTPPPAEPVVSRRRNLLQAVPGVPVLGGTVGFGGGGKGIITATDRTRPTATPAPGAMVSAIVEQ